MTERLALKHLTASDLTFFESLFRTLNVGNQKSINLNADIFVEQFYPTLPNLVSRIGDVIPVSLVIYGPNSAPADTLSRAITKREAYKNWRLNGEFVRDPEGQVGRYDAMKAGDLAVLQFSGDPVPQKVALLLISAQSPLDASLHKALKPLIPGGRKTMVQLSRGALTDAAKGVRASHPVWLLADDPEFDAALEDAALSGIEGTEKLAKITKPVSASTLAAAKATAEKNGREGEALAWVHLQRLKAQGLVTSIEWSSQTNAVAAYDFVAVDAKNTTRRIDAKSTSGNFDRPIHMSFAELTAAASGAPYDIWRMYEIDDDGAFLKVASDIAPVAKKILARLSPPQGVTVDCVSIGPKIFTWTDQITVEPPEEGEE